jgi:hypothetical protein
VELSVGMLGRLEFKLPRGDLGLELAAYERSSNNPTVNGSEKGKGKASLIGCEIRGWKKEPLIDVPIGSKIILIDGDYVETMKFHEIVQKLKNSSERIIVIEPPSTAPNAVGQTTQSPPHRPPLPHHHSPSISKEKEVTIDSKSKNSHSSSDQQLTKEKRSQQDGKLYLLQGKVEKTMSELTESRHRATELEKVIHLQREEIEKKEQAILHLKETQRDSDGQRMLLKYQLDRSHTQQQQQLLLMNQNTPTAVTTMTQSRHTPSSELILHTPATVEIDRSSFLLHAIKLKQSFQAIHRRDSSTLFLPTPPEEIDGTTDAMRSFKRPFPTERVNNRHGNETSERRRGGSLHQEVEILSDYRSDYPQDEFSQYLRGKLLSSSTLPAPTARGGSVHASDGHVDEDRLKMKRGASSAVSGHTSFRFPFPASQGNERAAPQFPHDAPASFHPQSRSLEPQPSKSSSRGHSQFQVESHLIHEEVKRFRCFMDDMRTECVVTPSSTSSLTSSAHHHRPQSHTIKTTLTSSHLPPPAAPSRSFISSTSVPHTVTNTNGSGSFVWRSSLDKSFVFGDKEEVSKWSTQSVRDLNRDGGELNFSHLRKISTSPPMNYESRRFPSSSFPS